MVVIRRIVGSALVAAALAGGVGIAAAPNAVARPRQCGDLIGKVQHAYDRATFNENLYGPNSSLTIAAWQGYGSAVVNSSVAGCYG